MKKNIIKISIFYTIAVIAIVALIVLIKIDRSNYKEVLNKGPIEELIYADLMHEFLTDDIEFERSQVVENVCILIVKVNFKDEAKIKHKTYTVEYKIAHRFPNYYWKLEKYK